MDKLKKLFPIKRLANKIVLMIVIIDIIILLVANLIMPHIFYSFLKQEAVEKKIVEVENTGINSELSFLIYINDKNFNTIQQELAGLDLTAAFNGEETYEEQVRGIFFDTEKLTEVNSYEGICLTDGKHSIGEELMEASTNKILTQDWYRQYKAEGYSSKYQIYQDNNNTYMVYIRTFEINGEQYDLLMYTYNDKYESIINRLNEFKLDDIIFYYRESNSIVFSTKSETDTSISVESIIETIQNDEEIGLYKSGENRITRSSDFNFLLENDLGFDYVFISSFVENDEVAVVIVHFSKEILLEGYGYIFTFTRYVLIGTFVISAFFIFIIIKRSTKGIKKLHGVMNQVRLGNFDVSIVLNSKDEVEELGQTFNFMLKTIQEYIDETVKQKKIESDMRYSLLISEIDPHFIYNTLSTITYLASLKRNDDIMLVSKALITILKDRLKIKALRSFDTIAYEMELVNQYMLIQKYLHSGCIALNWNVPDDIMNLQIPKNLIQPLVENALLHGLFKKKDENGNIACGRIDVEITLYNEYFLLEVKDSGVGMALETIQSFFFDINIDTTAEHIGIKNIKKRLDYLFNKNWSLKVDSKINEYTKVCLSFPINRLN